MKNLRELRLWHWREAMAARRVERYLTQWDKDRAAIELNKRKADLHMRAVIILNDCPECLATTAEQDDKEMQ